MKRLSKKDRNEFFQEVCCLIEEYGGILQEGGDESKSDYRMPTKEGMITFSIRLRIDHLSDIFGRFDISSLGQKYGGSPVGKCNHHFLTDDTKDSHFARFEGFIKRITIKEEKTPAILANLYVSDVVCNILESVGKSHRHGVHFMQDKPYMSEDLWMSGLDAMVWFSTHCHERLTVISHADTHIYTAMQNEFWSGSSTRGVMGSFIRLWLMQYLQCPDKYRGEHPLWSEPGKNVI